MEHLIYSPGLRIPLFRIISDSEGCRYVEYLNNRTGRSEKIGVFAFIVYLMETTTVSNDRKMVYSPNWRIPIGIMLFEKTGTYLEVKYKQKRESIRLSEYISLMLEQEVRKAS